MVNINCEIASGNVGDEDSSFRSRLRRAGLDIFRPGRRALDTAQLATIIASFE